MSMYENDMFYITISWALMRMTHSNLLCDEHLWEWHVPSNYMMSTCENVSQRVYYHNESIFDNNIVKEFMNEHNNILVYVML